MRVIGNIMEFKKWFIGERAKALAQVLLTRRSDLVVEETNDDSGLDFIVTLSSVEYHGERRFGVLLRGTMTPVTLEEANRQLKPTLARSRTLKDATYPVCVFFFTAKDDRGYFTWAYEPVVVAKGQPRLKYHAQSHCAELNNQSLEEIVGAVNKWYDALNTMLAT